MSRISCYCPMLAVMHLVLLTGCAGPWLKMMGETELPLVESQQPRVYPKAVAGRTSPPTPSTRASESLAAESRMGREIDRLTRLNDELSKNIVRSTPPPVRELPSNNQLREKLVQTAGNDLNSVFIEPTIAGTKKRLDGWVVLEPVKTEEIGKVFGNVDPAVAVEDELPNDKNPKEKEGAKAADEGSKYQSGDWLKARDQAISQLQEEIALAKVDKSRADEVGQLETLLRMHQALAGRRDDAVKPVKELHQQEQEFWRNEVLGVVDLLGPDRLANESRRFAVALKSLEEAESHLAAAGTLVLRNMALCRKVQDFGVVDRFKTADFRKNQEVLLYVEVRNFTAKAKDDHNYETELQGTFRILDRSGAARAERTLPLDKQTSANLRRDYYIAYRLYIPSELSPGAYTLELTIEDRKGNKSNNSLLDFNVVP